MLTLYLTELLLLQQKQPVFTLVKCEIRLFSKNLTVVVTEDKYIEFNIDHRNLRWADFWTMLSNSCPAHDTIITVFTTCCETRWENMQFNSVLFKKNRINSRAHTKLFIFVASRGSLSLKVQGKIKLALGVNSKGSQTRGRVSESKANYF